MAVPTAKSPIQDHHIITRDVAGKSELLKALARPGPLGQPPLFELNAPQNILKLPATRELATKLKTTPHNGGPLGSYHKRVGDLINDLADTEDGKAAIAGDWAVAERVAGRLDRQRDTLKTALDNNHLFTNAPENMTLEAVNKLNQDLLGSLDDYAVKHADAISRMGRLVGPEAEWVAILKSSETVEEVIKALQQAGKTDNLNSLAIAVRQATEAGRFSPSASLRGTLGGIFGEEWNEANSIAEVKKLADTLVEQTRADYLTKVETAKRAETVRIEADKLVAAKASETQAAQKYAADMLAEKAAAEAAVLQRARETQSAIADMANAQTALDRILQERLLQEQMVTRMRDELKGLQKLEAKSNYEFQVSRQNSTIPNISAFAAMTAAKKALAEKGPILSKLENSLKRTMQEQHAAEQKLIFEREKTVAKQAIQQAADLLVLQLTKDTAIARQRATEAQTLQQIAAANALQQAAEAERVQRLADEAALAQSQAVKNKRHVDDLAAAGIKAANDQKTEEDEKKPDTSGPGLIFAPDGKPIAVPPLPGSEKHEPKPEIIKTPTAAVVAGKETLPAHQPAPLIETFPALSPEKDAYITTKDASPKFPPALSTSVFAGGLVPTVPMSATSGLYGSDPVKSISPLVPVPVAKVSMGPPLEPVITTISVAPLTPMPVAAVQNGPKLEPIRPEYPIALVPIAERRNVPNPVIDDKPLSSPALPSLLMGLAAVPVAAAVATFKAAGAVLVATGATLGLSGAASAGAKSPETPSHPGKMKDDRGIRAPGSPAKGPSVSHHATERGRDTSLSSGSGGKSTSSSISSKPGGSGLGGIGGKHGTSGRDGGWGGGKSAGSSDGSKSGGGAGGKGTKSSGGSTVSHHAAERGRDTSLSGRSGGGKSGGSGLGGIGGKHGTSGRDGGWGGGKSAGSSGGGKSGGGGKSSGSSGGGKGGGRKSPVVLDLDHNDMIDIVRLQADGATVSAFDLKTSDAAAPRFDWTGDGSADPTAWAGPDDGFLAIDLAPDGAQGADGRIDQARELAFSLWKTEEDLHAERVAAGIADDGGMTGGDRPVTDLEGLRHAFDTNLDNVLDAHDARWSEFRVWQDLNQNGISEDGELKTMSEAGIKLFNLLPDAAGAKQFADGSAITGTATAVMTDGSTMLIADASLRFQPSPPVHIMA